MVLPVLGALAAKELLLLASAGVIGIYGIMKLQNPSEMDLLNKAIEDEIEIQKKLKAEAEINKSKIQPVNYNYPDLANYPQALAEPALDKPIINVIPPPAPPKAKPAKLKKISYPEPKLITFQTTKKIPKSNNLARRKLGKALYNPYQEFGEIESFTVESDKMEKYISSGIESTVTNFSNWLTNESETTEVKDIAITIGLDKTDNRVKLNVGGDTIIKRNIVYKKLSEYGKVDSKGKIVPNIKIKQKDQIFPDIKSDKLEKIEIKADSQDIKENKNNLTPAKTSSNTKLLKFLGDCLYLKAGEAFYADYLEIYQDQEKLDNYLNQYESLRPSLETILDADGEIPSDLYQEQNLKAPTWAQQQLLIMASNAWKQGHHDLSQVLPRSLTDPIPKDGEKDETKTMPLSNATEFMAWMTQQISNLIGEFPLSIQSKANEEGETQDFSAANLSEAIIGLTGLGYMAAQSSALNTSFLNAIGSEVMQTKAATLATQDYAKANADFLGYRGNAVKKPVSNNFNTNNLLATLGTEGIKAVAGVQSCVPTKGQNPKDKDDLEDLMRGEDSSYVGWTNEEKDSLLDYIKQIHFAANITKTANFKTQSQLKDEQKKVEKIIEDRKKEVGENWEKFKQDIADKMNAKIKEGDKETKPKKDKNGKP